MKDPCIGVCKFTDGVCIGCGRNKAEIKAWKKLGKSERRVILAEADMRLLALGRAPRKS